MLVHKLSPNVLATMHPLVACPAERNNVRRVESQLFISGPRLDMVRVQSALSMLGCSTSDAMVPVAGVDGAEKVLPLAGSVQPLTLGRTAVNESGIERAATSRHAVSLPAQVRFRDGRLSAENCLRFVSVRTTFKWVASSALHEVVGPLQVESARSRRYPKVAQFFVNALRISADQSPNLVRGQAIGDVLAVKPLPVKVLSFHVYILTPSMAVGQ